MVHRLKQDSYTNTTEPAIFWGSVTFDVYFFYSSIMTLHSLTHTIHRHATSISKRSQSSVLTLCWKHNRTHKNTANSRDSAVTNKRFYGNAYSEGVAKVKQHAEPKKACWDLSLFLDSFFLQISNCCILKICLQPCKIVFVMCKNMIYYLCMVAIITLRTCLGDILFPICTTLSPSWHCSGTIHYSFLPLHVFIV